MKNRKMLLSIVSMVMLLGLSGSVMADVLFQEDFTVQDEWKTRPEYNFTYDINSGDELVVQDTAGIGSIDFFSSVNGIRMGAEYHYELTAPEGMWYENLTVRQTCFANTSIGGTRYGRAMIYFTGNGWASNVGAEVSSVQSGEWVTLELDASTFDGATTLNFYTCGQVYYNTDWTNASISEILIEGDLVPEPATISFVALGALSLIRRRK